MDSALTVDRLQFAFTITFHYLFPQLTMGLAPLIVLFKTLAIWKKDERYNKAARFWAKIFAVTFLLGVIIGGDEYEAHHICLSHPAGVSDLRRRQAQTTPQLMPVQVKGKWGYADKKGKTVIAPQFDIALPFNDGVARVGRVDKESSKDKTLRLQVGIH